MSEKNVLLIAPTRFIEGRDIAYGRMKPPEYSPLNLSCLKAVLEANGFTATILDADLEPEFVATLSRLLQSKSFLAIGITCTTPLFENAKSLADTCKKLAPATPVVVGGIHPTLLPHETAEHPAFDFIVVGEGEITLTELVKALDRGDTDFSCIDGLVHRSSGRAVFNKSREQIQDLDSLPLPDRNLQTSYFYKYPDTLFRDTFPIVTSRGCPARCTFCCARHMFPKVRFRSARSVVDEINTLVSEYGAKEIHIWDDCFTMRRRRVYEIAALLEENNIRVKFAFPNGIRVDTVDRELLVALKNMGVYSIAFGVESGNQEVLNLVRKGITLEQVEKAFALAKAVKLETWGFFMIGLPGDNERTILDTIEFARRVDPDIAKFSILVPFPGTDAHRHFAARGLIVERDLAQYGYHSRPVHRLPDLSQDDLIRLHQLAYRRFYLRPGKVVQQLLRLKSWERVKTNVLTGLNVIRLIFAGSR